VEGFTPSPGEKFKTKKKEENKFEGKCAYMSYHFYQSLLFFSELEFAYFEAAQIVSLNALLN
jgi:hypothetical protein